MAKFFIERPIFAWVIALFVMVMGAVSITQLPIAQYPPVAPPSPEVSVLRDICRNWGSISFKNRLSRAELVIPFLKRLLAKVIVQDFFARVIAT